MDKVEAENADMYIHRTSRTYGLYNSNGHTKVEEEGEGCLMVPTGVT